jgi:hypothetical protein
LVCSRDVPAIGRQAIGGRRSDYPTLLHWSYSDAATFLPRFISAGRFDQRGDLARLGTPSAGACAEPPACGQAVDNYSMRTTRGASGPRFPFAEHRQSRTSARALIQGGLSVALASYHFSGPPIRPSSGREQNTAFPTWACSFNGFGLMRQPSLRARELRTALAIATGLAVVCFTTAMVAASMIAR